MTAKPNLLRARKCGGPFVVLSALSFLLAYFAVVLKRRRLRPLGQGWGTNIRTGKQEWFFANYASLQDCQFRTKTIMLTQPNLYREPSGCLYDGYQNPYVQWLVNLVAAYGKFKCVARLTDPELQRTGHLYRPVLSDSPSKSGDNWYCVI